MNNVTVKKMNAEWVGVERGRIVDISPLWAFIDEDGHTIIQIPSKKYPQKTLDELNK